MELNDLERITWDGANAWHKSAAISAKNGRLSFLGALFPGSVITNQRKLSEIKCLAAFLRIQLLPVDLHWRGSDMDPT